MKLNLDVAARIVSGDKIAQGAWLHLTRPGDGAPIYADEAGKYPARLKVRSHRHKAFQDALYQAQAAQATSRKGRGKAPAELVRDAFQEGRPRNFSLLVLAVENLDSSQLGKVIEASPEDLMAIAQAPEHQWIVDQVMNFAFNDSNFGAEDDAGNDAGGKAAS